MGKITPEEAKRKILRYCAYQERSHQEVKNKLFELGLYSVEVDEILAFLITEGFLNEERYARAFAGGKFRMKRWGRLKIVRELEQRKLSARCIRMGLQEIDEEDYRQALAGILEKKNQQLDEKDAFVRRDKLARYALFKGFEPELVWELIRQLLPLSR